jgi:hypothetical protein
MMVPWLTVSAATHVVSAPAEARLFQLCVHGDRDQVATTRHRRPMFAMP